MSGYRASERNRAVSVAAAVLVHLALGIVLLVGLGPHIVIADDRALSVFDVSPPHPPPTGHSPSRKPSRAQAAHSAPTQARAVPRPVEAPVPPLILPVAVVAAPITATGAMATAGAASAGPGTGSGGVGDGLGSGGAGTGGGGGSPARLIAGRIGNGDYPKEARRARVGGAVTVRFMVGPDGRARDCAMVRSSGVASLDTVTCALIVKRFRYAPARDATGRAVAEERGWRQDWWLEGRAVDMGE